MLRLGGELKGVSLMPVLSVTSLAIEQLTVGPTLAKVGERVLHNSEIWANMHREGMTQSRRKSIVGR